MHPFKANIAHNPKNRVSNGSLMQMYKYTDEPNHYEQSDSEVKWI